MNQKQYSEFVNKCGEILVAEQEDYKNKKIAKGEKVDFRKMHNAINQRKKVKQLNKIMQVAMFKTLADTRDMINEFKREHKQDIVFYIGDSQNLNKTHGGKYGSKNT